MKPKLESFLTKSIFYTIPPFFNYNSNICTPMQNKPFIMNSKQKSTYIQYFGKQRTIGRFKYKQIYNNYCKI